MRTSAMARTVLVFAAATLAVPAGSGAADPSPAEIRALVERLASSNQRPAAYPEVRRPSAHYPPGYNEAAQQTVRQAYQELQRLGPKAFPELIEHLDDPRYSLTGDTANVERNVNVGFLCRWLLERQICPFHPVVAGEGYTTGKAAYGNLVVGPRGEAPDRPDYFAHLLTDRTEAKKWAVEHQSYPLRVIQEEALKWMIAEEAKDPKTYDLEERTALKSLLRELQTSVSHLESSKSFFAK